MCKPQMYGMDMSRTFVRREDCTICYARVGVAHPPGCNIDKQASYHVRRKLCRRKAVFLSRETGLDIHVTCIPREFLYPLPHHQRREKKHRSICCVERRLADVLLILTMVLRKRYLVLLYYQKEVFRRASSKMRPNQ